MLYLQRQLLKFKIMFVKIKFKGTKYSTGKTVSFIKTLECPDFVELDNTENLVALFGKEILEHVGHTTSVNDQVMEWLDNQDKMYIIYDHDLQCIINYEVVEEKETKQSMLVKSENKQAKNEQLMVAVLENQGASEEMKATFNFAYQKVKDQIKTLPVEKQMKIVFSMLSVGYLASTTAYQNIIDKLNGDDKETEVLQLN